MDYLKIANSPAMWITAGAGVMVVIVQAILFVRKSLKAGKELGITDEQFKSAAKTSAVSAIGPSLVILAGMVSLLVTMGGPIAWMRLSYIGAVSFELMSAEFGAKALGITLGSPEMNELAFTNGVWVMALGSFGWVLFTGLFTHKMDKFRNVLAGGKKAFMPIVSVSAMLGAFAFLNADRVLRFDNGSIAGVAGFVIMALIVFLNKKVNKQWIKEWGLTIAMFSGMIIAALFIK